MIWVGAIFMELPHSAITTTLYTPTIPASFPSQQLTGSVLTSLLWPLSGSSSSLGTQHCRWPSAGEEQRTGVRKGSRRKQWMSALQQRAKLSTAMHQKAPLPVRTKNRRKGEGAVNEHPSTASINITMQQPPYQTTTTDVKRGSHREQWNEHPSTRSPLPCNRIPLPHPHQQNNSCKERESQRAVKRAPFNSEITITMQPPHPVTTQGGSGGATSQAGVVYVQRK